MTLFTKRIGTNMNAPIAEANYEYIDHLLGVGGLSSPVGVAWGSTTKTFMQCLDQTTGYPNDNTAASAPFGNAVVLPDPSVFPGPFTIDWHGDARVFIQINNFVINVTTHNCTFNAGNIITTIDPTQPTSCEFSLNPVGLSTGPQFVLIEAFSNFGGSGIFATNFRFYRSEDVGRLNAGKMFRLPWLQAFGALYPGQVRFLNWISWVNPMARFEHLGDPLKLGFGSWLKSPPYGDTTLSGVNKFALSAVSTGPNQTPATMKHGEVVTCRIGSGVMTRAGATLISSITNANPGKVTTNAPHGFLTGDVIWHFLQAGNMPKLTQLPVTITVVDATSYTIGIDTTTYGAFTIGGTPSPYACEYVTLNVGGRGDFPIAYMPQTGTMVSGANIWGPDPNQQLTTGAYKTFYFDKMLAVITDGNGNWVTGTDGTNSGGSWMLQLNGGVNDAAGTNWPIEHMVTYMNELNEVTALAGACPSPMWLTLPVRSMVTSNDGNFDPDYTTASDMPLNIAKTIKNGANGFPGLASGIGCIFEYSNEVWNNFFWTYAYAATLSFQRYGVTAGSASFYNWQNIRSVLCMKTIQAQFPGDPLLGYTIGLFGGGGGFNPGDTNYLCVNGSTFYDNDPVNTWHTPPIAFHDAAGVAPYVDPDFDYVLLNANINSTGNSYNSGTGLVTITIRDGQVVTGSTLTITGVTGAGTNLSSVNVTNKTGYGGRGTGTLTFTIATGLNITSITGGQIAFNGTDTFFDDVCRYNGTDNSGAFSMTCHSNTTSFTASFTAGNSDIVGTNTLSAGDHVFFATTVGNVPAGGPYVVNPTNLSGLHFQINGYQTGSGNPPSGTGTSTCTPGSITLVTTAVTNGPPTVYQRIVGNGINAPTLIASVSGSNPNYTITLAGPYFGSFSGSFDREAGVAPGTVITSPPNGGGNYIGAPNQAAALANWIFWCTNGGAAGFNFWNVVLPNQIAMVTSHAGKLFNNYEGGPNWPTGHTDRLYGVLITDDQSVFLRATYNSTQWRDAFLNFITAFNAIPGTGNSSILLPMDNSPTIDVTNQRWAYSAPDSYLGTTEGLQLSSNPAWAGMGAFNLALCQSGAGITYTLMGQSWT
jgi:hypothetical protein